MTSRSNTNNRPRRTLRLRQDNVHGIWPNRYQTLADRTVSSALSWTENLIAVRIILGGRSPARPPTFSNGPTSSPFYARRVARALSEGRSTLYYYGATSIHSFQGETLYLVAVDLASLPPGDGYVGAQFSRVRTRDTIRVRCADSATIDDLVQINNIVIPSILVRKQEIGTLAIWGGVIRTPLKLRCVEV